MSASVPDPRTQIVPLVPLETVATTQELARRPPRQANFAAESWVLVELTEAILDEPERVMQKLADIALTLCKAGSAGISIIEEEDGRQIFRWRALAGELASHLLGTTPREFSPCGTVVDRHATMLMSNLDLHYRYFADVQPRILEALLVPFARENVDLGTVWVVSHDDARRFDSEDARIMQDLAKFAGVCLTHSNAAASTLNASHQPGDATHEMAAIRLAQNELRKQLDEMRQSLTDGAFSEATVSLARLVFLADGVVERFRARQAGGLLHGHVGQHSA